MVCPHNYRLRRHPQRPQRGDRIEAVVFDMDGVLIDNGASWVLVHRHFGVENKAGYDRYMAGEIDDHEFIRTDVALWQQRGPVHNDQIDRVLNEPDFMPGAHETVERLHDAGIATAIVSGGLDHMANRVAKALGIDEVHANGLHVDERGFLTGEGVLRTPLNDKSEPLLKVADRLGIERSHMAAVGDSCPDQSMFEAVALGIAFRPADPCIAHAADHVVEERDLRQVLTLLR